MKNVFRHKSAYADVGPEWIERLKEIALTSPLRRSRLCLHKADDDMLHEMIIALAQDCIFPPHRHPSKTESYHMIDGRAVLILFREDGTAVRALLLTPPGQKGIFCFRLGTPAFHALLQLDDVAVFHEVTNGPFRKGEAVLAPWAPTGHLALREFLENAAISCGLPRELIKNQKTNIYR